MTDQIPNSTQSPSSERMLQQEKQQEADKLLNKTTMQLNTQ